VEPLLVGSAAPAAAEVEESAGKHKGEAAEGPKMVGPAPEVPSVEPIVLPPPSSTYLPEARLIVAGEVTGTRQQRPNVEETGTTDAVSRGILVTPPKSRYVVSLELVDDPMLSSDVLKHFQDTFKELYKFSTVCMLGFREILC
jgi:hypothetical protein